jgi:hypothetical protein
MPTASAVCPSEALARSVGRHNLCRCAHSLSSSSATREAIDLFLREEEATRALEAMLLDEPEWLGQIYVQPVEVDGFVAFFSSSDGPTFSRVCGGKDALQIAVPGAGSARLRMIHVIGVELTTG